MDEDSDDSFESRVLSKQSGAIVEEIAPRTVRKRGYRVKRNEEAALRLVKESTGVPVPRVYAPFYFFNNGMEHGSFFMDLVDGDPLMTLWDGFDEKTKGRICHDIWDVVRQLRQIPRPPAFSHLYQCGADGSASIDVLLRDLNDPPSPISADEALRARIYERYLHNNGGLSRTWCFGSDYGAVGLQSARNAVQAL